MSWSAQVAPVSGQLSAASGGPVAPAAGSVVQFPTAFVAPEQQCLVIISGARQGLQVVTECQDPSAIAPFYGVRSLQQYNGNVIAGGTTITIPDDPQGVLPAVALVAAVEGAGQVRVRCVALGSGKPSVLMAVGSFFGNSPVPPSPSTGVNAPTLLKILREMAAIAQVQSGLFAPRATDDGSGGTLTLDPSIGDFINV